MTDISFLIIEVEENGKNSCLWETLSVGGDDAAAAPGSLVRRHATIAGCLITHSSPSYPYNL